MPAVVSNPAWAPREPVSVLQIERGIFIGTLLAWGAWGVLLSVTIQCVTALWRNIRHGKRRHRLLLVYVVLMTSLATVGVSLGAKWQQTFFIDNRMYPGGPMAYYAKYSANPLTAASRFCAFMMNWMADGLLIYRLYVIYQGALLFVTVPILTFLASFAMSIVELDAITRPESSIFLSTNVNLGLIYWSLSIAVNIIVTVLIVARIFFVQRAIAQALGVDSRKSDRMYTDVSAMLIESAALYTIPGVIFLAGYSLQIPLQFTVEPLECIQGIAPLLIILRVANGTAYTATTVSGTTSSSSGTRSQPMGALRFASWSRSHPERESELKDFPISPIRVSLSGKDGVRLSSSQRLEDEASTYPGLEEAR
ncbi:hypothetical protein PENSPDRAFT_502472 [Peniophora sp. CONT]|nr:hypothetical protein PENSPDRAFT_502472 [Peniophora sp. CONT]